MISSICHHKVSGRRGSVSNIVFFSLIVSTQQLVGVLGAEPANALAASQAPQTVAELQELEARVRNTIRSVLPAIVAVDCPGYSADDKARDLKRFHSENLGSGVIIRSDGLIVSQFHVSHQVSLQVWRDPGDPAEVVLQDGRRLKAVLLGADPVRDLSLLQIVEPGEYPHAALANEHAVALGELQAVEWSSEAVQSAGTFVAAPDGSGKPIAVGIVSVPKRRLEGPFPAGVVKNPRRIPPAACPLEIIGKPADRGFRVTYVSGSAAKAGIVTGDVLVSINKRLIRQADDLKTSIQGRAPGDLLHVEVDRRGQHAELELTLEPELYTKCPPAPGNVRLSFQSFRYDDFPIVFEHDMPLTLDECGGPVIGLNGKALGITIARVWHHGCMAIPADAIEPLIVRLKAGNADTPK